MAASEADLRLDSATAYWPHAPAPRAMTNPSSSRPPPPELNGRAIARGRRLRAAASSRQKDRLTKPARAGRRPRGLRQTDRSWMAAAIVVAATCERFLRRTGRAFCCPPASRGTSWRARRARSLSDTGVSRGLQCPRPAHGHECASEGDRAQLEQLASS